MGYSYLPLQAKDPLFVLHQKLNDYKIQLDNHFSHQNQGLGKNTMEGIYTDQSLFKGIL